MESQVIDRKDQTMAWQGKNCFQLLVAPSALCAVQLDNDAHVFSKSADATPGSMLKSINQTAAHDSNHMHVQDCLLYTLSIYADTIHDESFL